MTKSYVKNASDPKQVKSAEDRENFDRKNYLLGLSNWMASKPGRSAMWIVLSRFGCFSLSYQGGEQRNEDVFFKEGMRNCGIELLADLDEACPEQVETMRQEARKNE